MSRGSKAEFPGGCVCLVQGFEWIFTPSPGGDFGVVQRVYTLMITCCRGGIFHPIQENSCAIEVSRGCMNETGLCPGGHFSMSRGYQWRIQV